MNRHPGPTAHNERGSATIPDSFADDLRRELRARNWTIRYCALRSGLDHSTISRLMKGQRMPTLATAWRLDEAFHGPSPSPNPAVRPDPVPADPTRRVAEALRRDPALDGQSAERVLRYYAEVRSRSAGPPPR